MSPAEPALRAHTLFRQQACLDGQWVGADNGATLAVHNPADGSLLGQVPRMGAAETRRAIAAAERALPAWSALTSAPRAARLRRWFELILQH